MKEFYFFTISIAKCVSSWPFGLRHPCWSLGLPIAAFTVLFIINSISTIDSFSWCRRAPTWNPAPSNDLSSAADDGWIDKKAIHDSINRGAMYNFFFPSSVTLLFTIPPRQTNVAFGFWLPTDYGWSNISWWFWNKWFSYGLSSSYSFPRRS